MKIAVLSLSGLCLLLSACSQPKNTASQKHYPLTGSIVSDRRQGTHRQCRRSRYPRLYGCHEDGLPNLHPLLSWQSLKVGEHIAATVNVSEDGSYSLSGIHENAGAAK